MSKYGLRKLWGARSAVEYSAHFTSGHTAKYSFSHDIEDSVGDLGSMTANRKTNSLSYFNINSVL